MAEIKAWSWRHAIMKSRLAPTTRLVLWTISGFMNERGTGCFPSLAEIAVAGGLNKATVVQHLKIAVANGWLVVERHGYGGRKWRRNEYKAAWPTDFTNASVADDEPDCGDESSDEVVAEDNHPENQGGCPAKPKVVAEDNHVIETSPSTSPIDPLPSPKGEAQGPDRDHLKKIEERFWKVFVIWPHFATASKPKAMRKWLRLSDEERDRAAEAVPHYLQAVASTKRYAVSMSSFLAQPDLWLPPRQETARPVVAAPFGKAWGAVRMRALLAGPGELPRPSAFIAGLIAQGGDMARREQLRHQATHGWPEINRMHERAAGAQGMTLRPGDEPAAALIAMMEPVEVDCARWHAWKAHHDAMGWPWLPDPGRQRWVYLPAGGPDGLDAFEAALRGKDDDGAGQEAAE